MQNEARVGVGLNYDISLAPLVSNGISIGRKLNG
jgi:hypothetical protein